MALYSFESPISFQRLKNKRIVADSSYLYRLSDKTDFRHKTVLKFHEKVKRIGGQFFINVVIRQEFLREVRKVQMIDTFLYLASTDPTLKTRYINKINQTYAGKPNLQLSANQQLTAANFKDCYDDLFKEHLRKGDINKLTSNWRGNVDSAIKAQEQSMRMNYISAGGSLDWSKLNNLMQATGMAPTDAMIANFALALVKADAIVTTDLDYMQVAGTPLLDVYMPKALAMQAIGIYDPTLD